MKINNQISEELIAPCGMNCAICSRYLSCVNDLKRSKCAGCRPIKGHKKCPLLKMDCNVIKNLSEDRISFCFECGQYPCRGLKQLDERYRNNYGMSMINNLEFIKKNGTTDFIKNQFKKYACPKCGNLISIHNKKCFKCDKITKLVDKNA